MENNSVDEIKREVNDKLGKKLAVNLGSKLLGESTRRISEYAGSIINLFIDTQISEPSIDLSNFISNKESFVISLLQIERCQ
jgi:hypothetical protein